MSAVKCYKLRSWNRHLLLHSGCGIPCTRADAYIDLLIWANSQLKFMWMELHWYTCSMIPSQAHEVNLYTVVATAARGGNNSKYLYSCNKKSHSTICYYNQAICMTACIYITPETLEANPLTHFIQKM